MKKGDSVIERTSGKQYIVFDVVGNEICIAQFFLYEPFPRERQVLIWQNKDKFIIIAKDS